MPYADPEIRRAYQRDYQGPWKAQQRFVMSILKLVTGCARCGYNENAEALDWHHVDPDSKLTSVSRLVSHTPERVRIELEKCILLCANCHRTEARHAD